MKGLFNQRRNSKSSQSGETSKVQQLDQTKKLSNVQQMNEQLQKLRSSYQNMSGRNDQLADSSSVKKIHFQESPQRLQEQSNSKNSPFSISQNQQIQQMISPIQAAPPSNQPSFKSLPLAPVNSQQISEVKELQQKIQEYSKSNQMLIERNAILENDLLLQRSQNNVLMHSNSHSNGINSLNNTTNSINLDRQLQAALIDKLRLEEIMEFMKEENEKLLEELNLFRNKSENLEKELKDTSQAIFSNQNQVQAFYSQNKKIEDQLKLSNIHFVNAQKKLTGLEKENKELNEKLNIVEQEKKKISQKWHAASQNRKQEEKLKQRIKELEGELLDKQNECEEFKKKYVSTNTELRVYKEGEYNYKDIVENKFKELKGKWQDETKQKEDLLKQNNELLSQLEQFSTEFQNLQQKYEKLQNENGNLQNENDQLQLKSEQIQIMAAKQELQSDINQSVQLTREELTKRLQQANQEITNLIKQIEDSNQQILLLQQDKHIMNKQIEEFLKQNEQLQEALNSLLSENQQEQELLSHLTSKNGSGSGSKKQIISLVEPQQKNQEQERKDIQIQKMNEISKVITESQEFLKLIESLIPINDESIVNEIKQKIDNFIQSIQTKFVQTKAIGQLPFCSDCNKSIINQNGLISNQSQKGFEKQYYEVKNLYDRLLVKHYNLQKKYSTLEEAVKLKQTNNLNSSFQINKNFTNQISPQDGSFEESQEQKVNGSANQSGTFLNNQQNPIDGMNDSFESVKQISTNIINQTNNNYPFYTNSLQYQIAQQQDDKGLSDTQQNNNQNNNSTLNKSYNFTSTLNSTNTNLIQNILKNDFNIKETLSDNSQKMLNTILNKFLNTQGLNSSQLINQTQNYKNSKSSGNLNDTSSSNRISINGGLRGISEHQQNQTRSGPPTRTLERSLLRRNKSKENYQLNNSSGHLNSHNNSNNTMLNQSHDTYQRRYQDNYQLNLAQQQQKGHANNNNNNNNNVQTQYTHYLKQRKNSNSFNQITGTPSSAGGGYQSIHQMNRSFDGLQQSGSKGSNSSYTKFIKRKAGQFYGNSNLINSNNLSNGKNNSHLINQSQNFEIQDQNTQQQRLNEFQYMSHPNYQF